MDGHGLYVLLAFGVTLLVLSANLVLPIIRNRAFVSHELRNMDRQQDRAES